MKLHSSLVLLIVIITFCNGLTKYTKDKIQRANANKVQKRVNIKPLQLKGKQLALVQGKGKQAKLTKTANAKRWMPSQNSAKNRVKYTPKVVNNTKRWMPAFSDLGQSDMESSMMFDSGIVSSDPPSAYPGNPQQPPVEYGIPQQDAASARQQTAPPEQSFLTPENNGQEIPYQGQAAMSQPAMGQPAMGQAALGQPQGNQYQGFGNDIESYTKEISTGLDGENGANTEYSALDNFQDSNYMNSKFQEGDYIGSSLQETKQPNLYDSFSLAPGMAENFVNPPKETGGGASKTDDGKSKGKADKGSKEENKSDEKGAKAKNEKGDSRDKDEDKVEKEEKDSGKGKKQKSNEKAKQNVKDEENAKAITGNDKDEAADGKVAAKESNDVSDSEDKGKETKETKGKTKEAKEKNVAKFDKGEKNEKEGEAKIKKLTKNKNNKDESELEKAPEKVSANQKADANSVGQSEVAQRVAASLTNDDDNAGGNKEEDGKEVFKVDSKGGKGDKNTEDEKDSKLKNRKGAAKLNKPVKNISTHKNLQGNENAKDDNDNDNAQIENNKNVANEKNNNQNDNANNEQEVKQATNQAAANSENDEKEEVDNSKNEAQQEVTNSKNGQQNQAVLSSNNDVKDDSRIKKLKQRISNQKLSRHHGKIQQDAAARYKITTDTENTVTDNALANNVSPVNGAIGLAAGELRKQLVTNLRHQLMKNVAAAIARGKGMNTATEGAPSHGGGMVQNAKPTSGQNDGAAVSGQAAMQGQENNEPSNKQGQGSSKMTSQGSDSASQQETASQQGSNSEGGTSQDDSESLVPTLMKMDKNMLVDTILKLIKKNKEGKMKEESKGESKGQKQMTGDNADGDKESQDGGTLNQSFHGQESGIASDEENGNSALVSQGHSADAKAVEGQEGATESRDAGGNAQGQQSQASDNEGDSAHAEYATLPVKAQGNTKYYKFKKLQGQGHIKGKLGRNQDGDDPYAQIGLVDPGNNDKSSHHKTSSLKADLEKQGTKISKFINNDGGNTESNDQASDNSQGEVQQSANQNQESPNQGSSSQQSSNQRSDQESAGNQESAQQSNGNQGNQDQQSASNQSADSKDQSSDQGSAANQQSDQETQQQQQPQVTTQDGVTTETQINADSPKMVAQLLKISQRLHEINNKKTAAQNEKQTNNGNSKTVTNNFTDAEVPQKSRDDAYATIGSFDPNVKKKAAIGKKKSLMSKLGLSNVMNNISRRS